jgi:hypothetical protein
MAELKPAVEAPRIKVGVKFLMNLGNFENATVEIEIEDSVRPGEHIDEAFDRIYAKADEQLNKRAKALRADADSL